MKHSFSMRYALPFARLFTCALLLLPSVVCTAQTTADSIRAMIPNGNQVFRYGYQESSAAQKQIYDDVLYTLCGFEANNYSQYYYHRCDLTCIPNTMTIQDVMHLLERMQRDIPELYILQSPIPRYDYETYVYYARISYTFTPEMYLDELHRLRLAADTILQAVTPDMSDYEKLLAMHDGFIAWGDYGDITGAWAGSIKGAILNKRAICEGFARAGVYLCQQIGIPCIYISGQLCTSTQNDEWGNHAWNYVQLDGNWYLMDLTTDGAFPGICGYSAFLKGDPYLQENYRLTNTEGGDANLDGVYQSLPTLSATDYDPTTISDLDNAIYHTPCTKRLHNGHLLICRDGILYTLDGTIYND